ncbi:28S ribosomal protein S7, mitochondrial [Trichinella spiralis]|uniref:28S ribosomal protein S7, mitochondrial n=1 Tax=Trichinella spiralis TaxID=6334 RepID=A0A0V1BRF6_TRISP|nr:28S ribosomal protein S7, mitochondrial [Trichinella spiralis]
MLYFRRICGSCFTPNIINKRTSIWNPTYQDPITDKSELDLPLSEDDPRKYRPIKPLFHSDATTFFHDPVLITFTHMVMKDGRKDLAQRIMANCFEYIKRKQVKKWLACNSDEERKEIECNPWKIFHKAIENCTPVLKLMPATRGGITYQVNRGKGGKHFGICCKLRTCRIRGHTETMAESLGKELLDAFNNEGRIVKKKQDLHRQCEANKAYAHYRWK